MPPRSPVDVVLNNRLFCVAFAHISRSERRFPHSGVAIIVGCTHC